MSHSRCFKELIVEDVTHRLNIFDSFEECLKHKGQSLMLFQVSNKNLVDTQQTFPCSKSTIETLENV